jgi:hypothetical protein
LQGRRSNGASQEYPMEDILGNNCGHVKDFPRYWQCPVKHGRRYGVLEYAKERLRHFYHYPREWLTRLHYLNKHRYKRSERREAIVLVGQVILHYLDMDTLKVGVSNPGGGFWVPTLEWLAQMAGIGLKRAQRAIRDLARAGYIEITFRWTQHRDKSFLNKAAIRKVSTSFFHHLGISSEQLNLDQHRARKKQVKKPEKTPTPGNFPVVNHANFRELAYKALGKPLAKPPPKKQLIAV